MSNHYRVIQPSVALSYEVLPDYPRHKDISLRGINFSSNDPIEVGSILQVSLKTISATGSFDFFVNVFKCIPSDGGIFEIHANFYDINHARCDEIEDFITAIQ